MYITHPQARRLAGVVTLCGLGLLGASGALAQVYRCTTAQGQLSYSDTPCAPGQQGQAVQVWSTSPDASQLREQALKAENERLKAELATRPTTAAPQPAPAAAATASAAPAAQANTGRTAADLRAEKSGSPACRAAQRDLEVANSSITRKSVRAEELAMYNACGMEVPTTVHLPNRQPEVYLVPRPRPVVVPTVVVPGTVTPGAPQTGRPPLRRCTHPQDTQCQR